MATAPPHLQGAGIADCQNQMAESLARVAAMLASAPAAGNEQTAPITAPPALAIAPATDENPFPSNSVLGGRWEATQRPVPPPPHDKPPSDVRDNKRERRSQINQGIVAAIAASGSMGRDPLQAGHAGGADPEAAQQLMQAYITAAAANAANMGGEGYYGMGASSSSSGEKPAKRPKVEGDVPAAMAKKMKKMAKILKQIEAGTLDPAGPQGFTPTVQFGMPENTAQALLQPQAQQTDPAQQMQQQMMAAMMGAMGGMGAGGMGGMAGMTGMAGMQGMQGMAAMQGMSGMPGMLAPADPMAAMAAMMGGMGGMGATAGMATADPMAAMNPMMAAFAGQAGMGDMASMGFCMGTGSTDMQAMEGGAAALQSFLPAEVSSKAKARLAMQYASISAQQVQLARQSQFHEQMKNWEKGKAAGSTVAAAPAETRFQNGYRPTQLCKKFFLYEGCAHGVGCTFAHAYEELHPASAELIDKPGSDMLSDQKVEDFETQEPHMRMKKKREMCQRFQNKGECLLGKRCMFAHTEADLGKVELVYDDRVKTEICRKWDTGKCVFGRYCPHAHGMEMIGRLKPPEEICRMSAPIRPKGNDRQRPDAST